jgi:PPOX class probable F420-dependent enzyme
MTTPPGPPTVLSDRVRAFLERPIVATIATTSPDGRPHQAVAWYRLEPDGTILVNSRAPRHWPGNVRRTGRVSLAVIDPDNDQSWVGVACDLVTVVDDVERAQDDIVSLAHRYRPGGPSAESEAAFRSQERITFLLRPVRVHDHLAT